eukprot:scaffold79182_cov51-Prasinocladus_malaysianus.AAC.3
MACKAPISKPRLDSADDIARCSAAAMAGTQAAAMATASSYPGARAPGLEAQAASTALESAGVVIMA